MKPNYVEKLYTTINVDNFTYRHQATPVCEELFQRRTPLLTLPHVKILIMNPIYCTINYHYCINNFVIREFIKKKSMLLL